MRPSFLEPGVPSGRKKKAPLEYRLRWNDVKYEPGELRAVAYKNGKPWAEDTVKTTGLATGLVMEPDRQTIQADGTDISFVTVRVADEKGATVPRADNPIEFKIAGPGEIAAVDGNAISFESFQAPERKAYNGLALVIIRSKSGTAGDIVLTASSPGLKDAKTQIRATQPAQK